MTEALPDAQKEALKRASRWAAMGSGEDIGAAVVYLASKEAGYVTGQTLAREWRHGDAVRGWPLARPCRLKTHHLYRPRNINSLDARAARPRGK